MGRYSGPNGQSSVASKWYLLSLMGWSLVLMLAAFHVVFGELSTAHEYVRGQSVWALLVACLSLKDGAMLLMMQSADVTRKYIAAWQFVLWISAAIVLTMTHRAPFRVASNGYFAVWLGAASAVALAFEEFQQALTATTPLKATAVYTACGFVLLVDSSEFIGEGDPFTCGNAFTGIGGRDCSGGLASFAFVYGLMSMCFGILLMLLMYVHAGTPPTTSVLAPLIIRLRSTLATLAAFVVDGPIRIVASYKLTPLKGVGTFLLAFAISAALSLTYFFPPYSDLDNGFVACWLSVSSAAMLLQEPPQVAEVEEPRNLAVITTISGDAAAAELGVSGLDDPSRRSLQVQVPAERPSKRLLQRTHSGETRPPFITVLGLACILVVIAAAERLNGPRHEGVANGVSSADGEAVYALVSCAITLIVLMVRYVLLEMKMLPMDDNKAYIVRVSMSSLVAVLWTIAALLLTFVGPFVDVGNGYVATVAAFGGSIALVLDDIKVQSVLLASRPLQ